MLSSVTIQNFKGIREGALGELAQVNILVGRNNTGKSTIIEAIVLGSFSIHPNDLLGRAWEAIMQERVGRALSAAELRYGLGEDIQVSVRVDFSDGRGAAFVTPGRRHTRLNPVSPTWATDIGEKNSGLLWNATLIDAQLIRQLGLIISTLRPRQWLSPSSWSRAGLTRRFGRSF